MYWHMEVNQIKCLWIESWNLSVTLVSVCSGISEYASTPDKASDYISPLLSFAAQHIPKNKHQETPLYILCTAGMRVLPERCVLTNAHLILAACCGTAAACAKIVFVCSQQEALLEDLRTDIPVNFNFLFSDSHVEVISGKQEGKTHLWTSSRPPLESSVQKCRGSFKCRTNPHYCSKSLYDKKKKKVIKAAFIWIQIQ